MGEASADGLFTLAQTNGMMRARTAGMPGKTAISRKGPLAWTSATVNKQDVSRLINRGTGLTAVV
jgi:hypothetical protein